MDTLWARKRGAQILKFPLSGNVYYLTMKFESKVSDDETWISILNSKQIQSAIAE